MFIPIGRNFGRIFLVFGDNVFQIFRHDFLRFLHIWTIFMVDENGKNAKNLDHEIHDLSSGPERGL